MDELSFRGGRLAALRRQAGLSRRRFLALADLYTGTRTSVETLRRQESGGADPRWSQVAAYADVLGVPTDTFRGDR